ncbi:S24 family peptidase [Leptospira levettii]|uniref:S24 family peptidase n=1 Tax=Leptospira levettii TaxID=2023178 RepID=UPI001EEA165B|nr:S24 family peptidase [Leptospira levettii]MCG6150298.1 S24 family peptidase [Leptospira levettii]
MMDLGFYDILWDTYFKNRTVIRRNYKELTKKILDYNDPDKEGKFLRLPQFQALEIYIFLKECLGNAPLTSVFKDWHHHTGPFEKLEYAELKEGHLFKNLDEDKYKEIYEQLSQYNLPYSNYIFALTMGTGKTLLMATCIYYEFLLANKFPKDKRYAHNALIFAPDKTVLESLREIESFDLEKVIPKENAVFLRANINTHFLTEPGVALNTTNLSRFNIIVSNVQKVILKRDHSGNKTIDQRLFAPEPVYHVYSEAQRKQMELLKDESIQTEEDLKTNQRFQKLLRLKQLAIYLDEAHHAFGSGLEKNLTHDQKKMSSLRLTINELANKLKESGTNVIACFNYTGTPFAGNKILPDVVYSYGLKEAIDKKYLKRAQINSYKNAKDKESLKLTITEFWQTYGETRREGMLPKIAIFASDIQDVDKNLRPTLEKILTDLGIPTNKILVNVGDEKLTTNAEIREFNRLDSAESEKQFILLVNKGREGWNCRSLFAVALFRTPKSKIFVLQATMRCLRAVEPLQQKAIIFLSEENKQILDDELQKNFRLSVEDFQGKTSNKLPQITKVRKPFRTLTINRRRKRYETHRKNVKAPIDFGLNSIDYDQYRITQTIHSDAFSENSDEETTDITSLREKKEYSDFRLVAELAKYFTNPEIKEDRFIQNQFTIFDIEKILLDSEDGLDLILKKVNEYNQIIYDILIPKLFSYLYETKEFSFETKETIQLIRGEENQEYEISCHPDKMATIDEEPYRKHASKSFHLDRYCFDSNPEKKFFDDLLRMDDTREIYFTGMLTHGQSDFSIPYVDPETHRLRHYYPDFVVHDSRSHMHIVEVKGDYLIDDPIVRAKANATREAMTDSSSYKIISGKQVEANKSHLIFSSQEAIDKDLEEMLSNTNAEEPTLFVEIVKIVAGEIKRRFKDILPIYSIQAACGKFGESIEVEDPKWVECKGKLNPNMFIVQALGSSMEPKIKSGQYLVCEANIAGSKQGKIVLVQHHSISDPETGGSYTIKRYYSEKKESKDSEWEHTKIDLRPDNKEFETIVVSSSEAESLKVIAVVKGIFDPKDGIIKDIM